MAKRPTERQAVKRVGRKPVYGMTEGADRVWFMVTEYIDRNGFPPTLREIANGLFFATNNPVVLHLARLEALGYLQRLPGVARGIRLLKRHPDVAPPSRDDE